MAGIVIGPLMRHVDETSASVWVETDAACTVTVRAGGSWSAGTFRVHGHHYALVEVEGLEPGSRTPYVLELDGRPAWPEPGSTYPPPVIATLRPGKRLRLAFGSCRTSVGHDEAGNRTHGVDALRAYALRMAGETGDGAPMRWPDLLLFLGDQVYADETTETMQEFIAARRDIDQPPGRELQDFEEYAYLYRLAWTDPVNRWLLSTLPTAMIFDDHDVRDDWNTSAAWRARMQAKPWWQGRIVAALASYWVYQHLGNLSPQERACDEIWRQVRAHDGPGELDLSETLDAFAARCDREPASYRWSYARELAGTRLVVVDNRAARVVEGRRVLLDDDELAWLDGQLRGDVEHLLIGTSLPFLLAPGLHGLEAFSEALAAGRFGRWLAAPGEVLRQAVDLEHWAAFHATFLRVAEMVLEVAAGQRGRAPRTVTFLSGDVHHSYVAEVDRIRAGRPRLHSRVVQAVCSPMRNPLSRHMRYATAVMAYGVAGPVGRLAALSARVPEPPLRWSLLRRPWFDNNIATLEVTGAGLRMWWDTGEVVEGRHELPELRRVAEVEVG